MNEECTYSFRDLFFAAHNREMTKAEKQSFMTLPQAEINSSVKELAGKAGWGVQDKMGDDGRMYTAFCPNWSAISSLK